MTSKRERLAWLAFVAIIAIVAVTIPAGVSPTSRDLEFTAPGAAETFRAD